MRCIPIIVLVFALLAALLPTVTAAVMAEPPVHSFCWFEVTKMLPGMKSPPNGLYETDCGIVAMWV